MISGDSKHFDTLMLIQSWWHHPLYEILLLVIGMKMKKIILEWNINDFDIDQGVIVLTQRLDLDEYESLQKDYRYDQSHSTF